MIDVGQVLDKYQLLERVGQGGMAVVYRGLDTSLRRQVAVKVLHRHLSEHKEARDRFEREAHAVAKLRHENILEIFAYSGKESPESYIVTEFIEGVTLKQFIADHPPVFAEIGAMVVLQIARALVHAHEQGVLHRDVKPENVMIRRDGVVKLMDFGISQMLDTQRMTVTGQLLGSPAYMSPEHVEGRPLDFRTDVFAVGIVLYQLTVGKLPFDGRNPHEVLKRIGECVFADPRQANRRVGGELGKIILRAMARDPEERFQTIGELVNALQGYLDGSGLPDAAKELASYFASPSDYEKALRPRLLEALVRRSQTAAAQGERVLALDLLDRALTIESWNQPALSALRKLTRRRTVTRGVALVVGLVAVAATAWGARRLLAGSPEVATADAGVPDAAVQVAVIVDAPPPDPVDAANAALVPPVDAGGIGKLPPPPRRTIDAGAAEPVTLVLSPPASEIKVGNGGWQPASKGRFDLRVSSPTTVTARNEACCESITITVSPSQAGDEVQMILPFLPAQVVPRCAAAGVRVTIDGRPARLDANNAIPFGDTTQSRTKVTVEFVGDSIDTQTVTVSANQTKEVTCAL